MLSVPDQLVAHARQIATYRGYDNLENGLQPLNVLQAKLEHEQEEFAEAVASKDVWHQYHEAADLLYYAACIDAQNRYGYGEPNMSHYGFYNMFAVISDVGLNPGKAEKDENFEIELIRNAW